MSELVVPEGWEKRRIDEISDVVGGGTPSTTNSEFWDGDIPWATPSQITKLSSRYIRKTERQIS